MGDAADIRVAAIGATVPKMGQGLVDLGDKFVPWAANLLQVYQPIAFTRAIAQRQNDHAAQMLGGQPENLVDRRRVETLHWRGVDFLEGGSNQGRSQADIGLARRRL